MTSPTPNALTSKEEVSTVNKLHEELGHNYDQIAALHRRNREILELLKGVLPPPKKNIHTTT